MTNAFRAALAAAALAVAVPAASQAATVTVGPMPTTPVENPVGLTAGQVFHNANLPTVAGATSPWAGTDHENDGTGWYTAVFNGGSIMFTQGLGKAISFVWGTPDAFNTVQFLRDGAVVDSVDGTAVNGTAFVTLSNIAGGVFDAVRFASSGTAFEFAVLDLDAAEPAPVPVPAAGLMLLTAMGGVAAVRRRKA